MCVSQCVSTINWEVMYIWLMDLIKQPFIVLELYKWSVTKARSGHCKYKFNSKNTPDAFEHVPDLF